MGLVDIVEKAAASTRVHFSSDKDKWKNYLVKYDLKDYFPDDLSENERKRREGILEKKLYGVSEDYKKEIGGLGRKAASKGTMGLAVVNDIYSYVSSVPFSNVSTLAYALFGIKTLTEIPAAIRYLRKSHDWYGEIKHFALKPVRYLIPIVGPALESGAFDRMVNKRIRKEVKREFIREVGNYVPLEERVKQKLKKPLRDISYETGKRAPSPYEPFIGKEEESEVRKAA